MTPDYEDLDAIAVIGTGDEVPSSFFNQTRDNLEVVARPLACVVEESTVPDAGHNSWTDIDFTDPDLLDTDGMHSTSSNPDTITIPAGQGGWFDVGAYVGFAANGSGYRSIRATVGSTNYILSRDTAPSAAANSILTGTRPVYIAGGGSTTVKFAVFQTSGGALGVLTAQAWVRRWSV